MVVQQASSGRSWGFPVDNELIKSIIYSHQNVRWSKSDINSAISIIHRWWVEESEILLSEIETLDDLKIGFYNRLDLIDQLLAEFYLANPQNISESKWIGDWIDRTAHLDTKFWRYRLIKASKQGDVTQLQAIEKEIVRSFFEIRSSSGPVLSRNAVHYWIIEISSDQNYVPTLLIEHLVSTLTARRMPELPSALNLIKLIVLHKSNWLTDFHFELISLSLEALLVELNYAHKPIMSDITEDDIPLVRFYCAALAYKLIQKDISFTNVAASQWLQVANNDPLPELRFKRYI